MKRSLNKIAGFGGGAIVESILQGCSVEALYTFHTNIVKCYTAGK